MPSFYLHRFATGVVYSLATGVVGELNDGARSVFWSGEGNLQRATGLGRSLETTPVGSVMNRYKDFIPYSGWKAASCIYACNASGTVIKVGAQEGRIWSTFEKPILEIRGIPFKVVP